MRYWILSFKWLSFFSLFLLLFSPQTSFVAQTKTKPTCGSIIVFDRRKKPYERFVWAKAFLFIGKCFLPKDQKSFFVKFPESLNYKKVYKYCILFFPRWSFCPISIFRLFWLINFFLNEQKALKYSCRKSIPYNFCKDTKYEFCPS